MEGYLTVLNRQTGEYEEKRSRFIATIQPVESEEEAILFIKEMKSKYYDARHNVFAYRIKGGESRFSDDGEPHGTAGKPMLDILCGRDLYNVCVVVTRYFGGILLGTGGLVKAYSESTKSAINNSTIVEMGLLGLYNVSCDYSEYDRLLDYLKRNDATVNDSVFTDRVLVSFSLDSEKEKELSDNITEAFNAKFALEKVGNSFAPVKFLEKKE